MAKNERNHSASHREATESAAPAVPLVLDDELRELLYNTVTLVDHVRQLVEAKLMAALCSSVPQPLEASTAEAQTFERFLTRVQNALLKLRSRVEALGIGRGAESAEAIAAGIPPLLTNAANELSSAANDLSPRFQIQKLAEGVRNAAAAVTKFANSFTIEQLKVDTVLRVLLKEMPSDRTLEVQSFLNVPKPKEQRIPTMHFDANVEGDEFLARLLERFQKENGHSKQNTMTPAEYRIKMREEWKLPHQSVITLTEACKVVEEWINGDLKAVATQHNVYDVSVDIESTYRTMTKMAIDELQQNVQRYPRALPRYIVGVQRNLHGLFGKSPKKGKPSAAEELCKLLAEKLIHAAIDVTEVGKSYLPMDEHTHYHIVDPALPLQKEIVLDLGASEELLQEVKEKWAERWRNSIVENIPAAKRKEAVRDFDSEATSLCKTISAAITEPHSAWPQWPIRQHADVDVLFCSMRAAAVTAMRKFIEGNHVHDWRKICYETELADFILYFFECKRTTTHATFGLNFEDRENLPLPPSLEWWPLPEDAAFPTHEEQQREKTALVRCFTEIEAELLDLKSCPSASIILKKDYLRLVEEQGLYQKHFEANVEDFVATIKSEIARGERPPMSDEEIRAEATRLTEKKGNVRKLFEMIPDFLSRGSLDRLCLIPKKGTAQHFGQLQYTIASFEQVKAAIRAVATHLTIPGLQYKAFHPKLPTLIMFQEDHPTTDAVIVYASKNSITSSRNALGQFASAHIDQYKKATRGHELLRKQTGEVFSNIATAIQHAFLESRELMTHRELQQAFLHCLNIARNVVASANFDAVPDDVAFRIKTSLLYIYHHQLANRYYQFLVAYPEVRPENEQAYREDPVLGVFFERHEKPQEGAQPVRSNDRNEQETSVLSRRFLSTWWKSVWDDALQQIRIEDVPEGSFDVSSLRSQLCPAAQEQHFSDTLARVTPGGVLETQEGLQEYLQACDHIIAVVPTAISIGNHTVHVLPALSAHLTHRCQELANHLQSLLPAQEQGVPKRRSAQQEKREGQEVAWPADLLLDPLAPVMARITEAACGAQIRTMLSTLVASFLEQGKALDVIFKDDKERSAVTSQVKALLASFTQTLEDVANACCQKSKPLRPPFAAVQDRVRSAANAFEVSDSTMPKPIAALFRRTIVTAMSEAWGKPAAASTFEAYHGNGGFDAPPRVDVDFDILALPTEDEMQTEQEKVAARLAPLKHGLLLAMIRNICTAVPRTRVTIKKRGNGEEIERNSISSSDFSMGWTAHMLRGIEDTLTNHVKRYPRRRMDLDVYVTQCFRQQGVIFSRAGRDVEQELKKLTPAPEQKILTAMRGSLPKEQEETVPSTPEEMETFVVQEFLGGRSEDDGLFPQEAETVKQWCVNTLEGGVDVSEQMTHHLPALHQLAAEFDRSYHADLLFRRKHSDETLLALVRPIAAQVLLHRTQRDEEQKRKLRELAGELLPENVAQLKLLNEENEAWMQSWPAKHRKDCDVIGFAQFRKYHENACAFVERCELQGGEAAGYTLAQYDAETVRLARKEGVIVVVEEETSEGEERKRTRKSLKQDTAKVWAFLGQRMATRELLVSGASAHAHELHADVHVPAATILQIGREMPDLERRLLMLPDHSSKIAEIEARLTHARSEQEKLESRLDELNDSIGEDPPTQEMLSEGGNDLLACIRGLRVYLPEERGAVEQKLEETKNSFEKTQNELYDYARGGGMDPPVVNRFNKTISAAKKEIARITKYLEERRDPEIASVLDDLELSVLEHLGSIGSPDTGNPEAKPTDSASAFHALKSNAASFGNQCEKHVRLREVAGSEKEFAARNAVLKQQIVADARSLKTLRKEQADRDKVASRLEEYRRICTTVGNVLPQLLSPPNTNA